MKNKPAPPTQQELDGEVGKMIYSLKSKFNDSSTRTQSD